MDQKSSLLPPEDESSTSDLSEDSVGFLHMLRPAVRLGGSAVAVGDLIDGRFQVEELLGTGGMGEVYRVSDVYRNGEQRALKVIRAEYSASSSFVERFRKEVGNLLAITHQNVCRAYDLGIDKSTEPERLYYTMEFVEGPTLAQHLKQNGPLNPADLEKLALGLIAGLEVAHCVGLVHRDLKPSNIILRQNRDLSPVILDFGLALEQAAAMTESDVAGTRRYMAPEQRAGGAITPRTDIFALGMVLYEASTPTQLETLPEITEFLETSAVQSPTRRVRQLVRPVVWPNIIAKCISERPEERYESVSRIAEAIRWEGKLPRRIAIGMGIAAAAAVGIGYKSFGTEGYSTSNKEAAAAFERGMLHSKRLVPDELLKSEEHFRRATELDPSYGRAWAALSESYSRLGDYGGLPSRVAFDKGHTAAREAIRTAPRLAHSHAAMGLVLSIDPTRWTQAEPSFRRAIELDPAFGSTFQWYGGHLARLGRTRDAIQQLAQAVASEPFSLPVSVVYGWMFYYDRQYTKGLSSAEQTLDLDPNFVYGHVLHSRCLTELGRYDEAVRACENAARISISSSKSGKVTPVSQSALASALGRNGDREGARQVARKLEQERKAGVAIPVHYIAAAYCEAGDHELSLDLMEKGFNDSDTGVLYLKVYPPFDPVRGHPRYQQLVERLGYPRG